MGFSVNLKEARERANLSQRQISEMSGVSQSAISAIEKGDRSPTEATMGLIADALGCSISELIGDETHQSGSYTLTADEKKLINDYRSLNEQGKELIRQNMMCALAIYIKHNYISGMEDQEVG